MFQAKEFQKHYEKLLEGTVAGIRQRGGRKHPERNLVFIDTQFLFIVVEAF